MARHRFLPFWVLLGALGGCEQKVQTAPPPAAAPVEVAKTQARQVVPYQIFTASLAANQYVQIRPQVEGFISQVNFKPGQVVGQGDVLFRLDDRAAKAQFAQATADLAVKKANLQNAQDELERQNRLASQDATNDKDLLNARSNERGAIAAVDSATAALDAAKVNLDYHTIYAPFSGLVDVNTVDLGALVGPGGAKPLTTIASIDPIYADFSIPEELLVQALRRRAPDSQSGINAPAMISIGTENDFKYPATVDFISNTVAQATGTIPARATARNPDIHLYPGMFVRVKVNQAALPDSIVVREDATGRDVGGDFVWVITADNTAEKRYVKLGKVVDDGRIVESGLKPGETYVTKGLLRVRERGKVTPKQASATTAPATTAPVASAQAP